MTVKNNFDIVMDYIDENITKDIETIKKGIHKTIGCNSNDFGKCFSVLTNQTLFHYIRQRKFYFAIVELQNNKEKSICDIALDYGYSEQSAFSRAIKNEYNCTPDEIRRHPKTIESNRFYLSDFNDDINNSRINNALKQLNHSQALSQNNLEYLLELEKLSEEYQIDIDTCYAIADVAEKLEVPVCTLISKCFELFIDIKTDPAYIPQRIEMAMDCGITSDAELEAICTYYNCKYYDLDSFMVDAYRDAVNEKS